MFAFSAIPVKFAGLLVLFAWCTIWSAYELTRPQDRRQRVSGALHLGMAVVMLLMVPKSWWMPLTRNISIWVLVAAFAAATAWFGYLAAEAYRDGGFRNATVILGHTAMFAAMTWHLTAMAFKRSMMAGGMKAGGMGTAAASKPGGVLWTMALIGVPFMAYLLLAAVNDVRRAVAAKPSPADCACGANCTCGPDCACQPSHVTELEQPRVLVLAGGGEVAPQPVRGVTTEPASCHAVRPQGSLGYRLSAWADFAMNFGMFWMSTGLMVALLPFFAKLSF